MRCPLLTTLLFGAASGQTVVNWSGGSGRWRSVNWSGAYATADKVVIGASGSVVTVTSLDAYTNANEVEIQRDAELVIEGELCIGAGCSGSAQPIGGIVRWVGGAGVWRTASQWTASVQSASQVAIDITGSVVRVEQNMYTAATQVDIYAGNQLIVGAELCIGPSCVPPSPPPVPATPPGVVRSPPPNPPPSPSPPTPPVPPPVPSPPPELGRCTVSLVDALSSDTSGRAYPATGYTSAYDCYVTGCGAGGVIGAHWVSFGASLGACYCGTTPQKGATTAAPGYAPLPARGDHLLQPPSVPPLAPPRPPRPTPPRRASLPRRYAVYDCVEYSPPSPPTPSPTPLPPGTSLPSSPPPPQPPSPPSPPPCPPMDTGCSAGCLVEYRTPRPPRTPPRRARPVRSPTRPVDDAVLARPRAQKTASPSAPAQRGAARRSTRASAPSPVSASPTATSSPPPSRTAASTRPRRRPPARPPAPRSSTTASNGAPATTPACQSSRPSPAPSRRTVS